MLHWLKELDRVLRGDATRVSAIREGTIRIPPFGMIVMIVLLGLFTGFCVGWFALFNRQPPVYNQLLASAVKVPLLFFLTLLVTFPSLYVFNALVGSRLSVQSVFRLLIAALAVTTAVVASFGPITAFFSVSTENYFFMVLLNVVLFAVAGSLGLMFLLRTLHRLSLVDQLLPPRDEPNPRNTDTASAASDEPAPPSDPAGALDRLEGRVLGRHVKSVFYAWIIVFGLVGAQMAWVLRPFIGNPHQPFTWFRPRSSNFFEALFTTIQSLVH